MAAAETSSRMGFLQYAQIVVLLWVAYLVSLAVYRLYLSPIAKFPGPKLAALSKWYEAYYEIVCRGQFSFHIQELHKKYGPIIRITPEEIHIQDPYFWDDLYVRPNKADKYEWMAGRFGNNTSTGTTSAHEHWRLRRIPLNGKFSKREVLAFQPVVQEKLETLCRQIAAYEKDARPVKINDAYGCFTGDVIMEYAFGFNYNAIESADFKGTLHDAFLAVSEFGHVTLQFPFMTTVTRMMPEEQVMKSNPPLAKLIRLVKDVEAIITRLKSTTVDEPSGGRSSTIFTELLQSDLPDSEKSLPRLRDEAQTILGAGVDTTAWSLSVATYYICSNPSVYRTLKNELKKAFPHLDDEITNQACENLPYLRGCVKEGVRLSTGVSARMPRLLKDPLVYKEWVVPPNTPIAMTIMDVNFNDEIFKRSREFVPERWIEGSEWSRTAKGEGLERFVVTFSKGTRACLGINLAYMELFLGLAYIFRRFDLELYETDVTDVELKHDFFLPSPKLDTKGVRVMVKAATS